MRFALLVLITCSLAAQDQTDPADTTTPAPDTGAVPASSPSAEPAAVAGSAPESVLDTDPQTSPAADPGTVSGTVSGTVPGTVPGTVTGTVTGTDPSEALARELIAASGGADLGIQVMRQLIDHFRRLHPDVPDAFWPRFQDSVDPDELVALVIPVYTGHLSDEEMRAAIAFYRSPPGRALVTKLPAITHDAMAAGQRWGSELGERVTDELQTLASPLPQEPQPASESPDQTPATPTDR